jgi:hypothetical protein
VESSSIGSGDELNMYLNPRVHGSILTEGKKSTREGGGEDREVAAPRSPRWGPGLLRTKVSNIFL